MEGCILNSSNDRWSWSLDGSGEFSVSSVRKAIDDSLLPHGTTKTRWIKTVPIKINIHAWKVKNDCLPTRFNISRRGMDIDSILCPICESTGESSKHLFFSCSFVKDIMRKVTRWWDIDYKELESYDDWLEWMMSLRIQSNQKKVFEGICYITWWYTWYWRNKKIFGQEAPKKINSFDEVLSIRMGDFHDDNVETVDEKKQTLSWPVEWLHNTHTGVWPRPEADHIKVNCDAAWQKESGKAGLGFVARDYNGEGNRVAHSIASLALTCSYEITLDGSVPNYAIPNKLTPPTAPKEKKSGNRKTEDCRSLKGLYPRLHFDRGWRQLELITKRSRQENHSFMLVVLVTDGKDLVLPPGGSDAPDFGPSDDDISWNKMMEDDDDYDNDEKVQDAA
ncbi:RNA-directed DNA polymerase, eukaryota, reverse transcriptase zinc-binding domain protein [Tanacetum coccineum]